ncbi:hypothetical protein QUF74_08595 [Candidatus Halobeggiatoa sp. HSG11]|nr:hypothetical protein [Candidatus Halobeggiatoa sp. HSG11]
MEIFINELSLEGQFATETEFQEAVKIFSTIFVIIHKKIQTKKLYKNTQLLINNEAIKGSNFNKSLNGIKDKGLKLAFKNMVFNKLEPKEWRDEQIHSIDDNFDYITTTESLDVKDTSLAEITERSLQNKETTYLLINFKNSRFTKKHQNIPECFLIPIIKNNDEENPISLDCLDEKSALEHWIKVKLNPYDENFTNPPTDEQTILCDKERFEKTTQTDQGRIRYREKNTGRFWYVDNLHFGTVAHIEVFDKHGKHIGESNLQGNINYAKKDKKKTINL